MVKPFEWNTLATGSPKETDMPIALVDADNELEQLDLLMGELDSNGILCTATYLGNCPQINKSAYRITITGKKL